MQNAFSVVCGFKKLCSSMRHLCKTSDIFSTIYMVLFWLMTEYKILTEELVAKKGTTLVDHVASVYNEKYVC